MLNTNIQIPTVWALVKLNVRSGFFEFILMTKAYHFQFYSKNNSLASFYSLGQDHVDNLYINEANFYAQQQYCGEEPNMSYFAYYGMLSSYFSILKFLNKVLKIEYMRTLEFYWHFTFNTL
jgi:hypothetical protein